MRSRVGSRGRDKSKFLAFAPKSSAPILTCICAERHEGAQASTVVGHVQGVCEDPCAYGAVVGYQHVRVTPRLESFEKTRCCASGRPPRREARLEPRRAECAQPSNQRRLVEGDRGNVRIPRVSVEDLAKGVLETSRGAFKTNTREPKENT